MLKHFFEYLRRQSFCVAIRLQFGQPRNRDSISDKGKRLLSFTWRPDRLWRPTQTLTELVQGVLSPKVKLASS
jgi:hypothetical protein